MALYAKKLGFAERAIAPATPASGNREVYFKTDGKMYQKDSAGIEVEIGGGGDTGSVAWTDFSASAVLDWGEASPTIGDFEFKYRITNGLCYFTLGLFATNGDSAVTFSSTLPVAPLESTVCIAQQIVGASPPTLVGAGVTTNGNILYIDINPATTGMLILNVSGFYPV